MSSEIEISGYVRTDFLGIEKLYDFYNKAILLRDQTIQLNFYNLKFLDGNLCALFISMMYKLQKSNNLTFTTNVEFLKKHFNVLIRNGFVNQNEKVLDEQKSVVYLRRFYVNKLDDFIEYIQTDLMQHRGLNLTEEVSYKIVDSLIEIATNIEIHSNSSEPFFVCGQFFPELGVLKFSIVDFGRGFLPAIKEKTNGEINTHIDSILWALKPQNTTKMNEPGGLGLTDLYEYFTSSNGSLQIITGDAFWSTEFSGSNISCLNFSRPCYGTMINLLFSYN